MMGYRSNCFCLLLIGVSVSAIFALLLPFFIGLPFDTNGGFKLGDYGSWLSGSLTPIAISIAAFTLWTQFDAQNRTNAAQADANKYLLMGIMLDNIPKLEGHLNYLAAAAFWEDNVSAERANDKGHLGYITAMLDPPVDLDDLDGSAAMVKTEQMTTLLAELKRIINLMKASDTYGLLDGRIIQLYEKLRVRTHKLVGMRRGV